MSAKTKTRILSPKRLLAGSALLVLIVLGMMRPLSAQSITQGFASDGPLQKGMLVMLKDKDGSKVTVASAEKIQSLFGVVVNANDAPVTLSSDDHKVFVATQGHFDLLVSDENGPIKTGDYLTVSNINGVAMKADRYQQLAAAKAIGSFDGKTEVISSQKSKDKTINIGRIVADISISHNPLAEPDKKNVPKVLQTTSELIARKPVSAPRIYAGAFIFLVTMLIAGGMFYTGVSSSITAIGRNPLSKKAITRGLFQVLLTSLIIFIIGLFTVYLLIRL